MADMDTVIVKPSVLHVRECLDRVGKRFDVDLLAIVDDPTIAPEGLAAALRQSLYPAVVRALDAEPAGEDAQAHADIRARFAAAQATTAQPLCNVAFEQGFVTGTLASKTGSDVQEFVSGVMNTLSLTQAKGMTAAEIATTITVTGVFGLGPVVYYAAKATGTLAVRIVAGISKIGVTAWAGLAGVIVVEIGIFLMQKTAVFMGMIANNTANDLAVEKWRKGLDGADKGDLYLNHGKMLGFMVADQRSLKTENEVQIGALQTIAADDGAQTMVSLGLFYASKRDGALVGVEGAMIFRPKHDDSDPRLVLAFSCPYSGSNGAAVKLTNDHHSAEHWWDKLEDKLGLSTTSSSGSYTVAATVNAASGGEASAIVILDTN